MKINFKKYAFPAALIANAICVLTSLLQNFTKIQIPWQSNIVLIVLVTLFLNSITSFYAFVQERYLRAILFSLLSLFFLWASVSLVWILIDPFPNSHEMPESEMCKAKLRGVQSSLELYKDHYKYYPFVLDVLIKEYYLEENGNLDNWGNKLNYKPILFKGSRWKADNYLLGSSGPDGLENTEDDIYPPINAYKHSFRCNFRDLQIMLEAYKVTNGYYPDNLELAIEYHLGEKSDIDIWGNKYNYKPIYAEGKTTKAVNYLLGSNGPDGKPNTDDDLGPPKDTAKHSFKTKK